MSKHIAYDPTEAEVLIQAGGYTGTSLRSVKKMRNAGANRSANVIATGRRARRMAEQEATRIVRKMRRDNE